MEIIFSDKEVAAAKAEWEPQLLDYVTTTNSVLFNSRRLPIYEQAVARASEWLLRLIENPPNMRRNRTLILAGDEHLHAATTQVGLPPDSIFLYRSAWKHWWSSMFDGKVWCWYEASWAINCPQRIIDITGQDNQFLQQYLQLVPNETYLCSEQIGGRGAHSILSVSSQGNLTAEPFRDWLTL